MASLSVRSCLRNKNILFFPSQFYTMWHCFILEYLKPIAEEERKIEEAEKKAREEQERIAKQLAEGKMEMQIFVL